MRRGRIVIVSIAGMLAAATLAATPWESAGPPGCKVAGIGQSSADPRTLFTACSDYWSWHTDSGYPTDAYRSRDGGETWEDISDPRMVGVQFFVVAPSDPPVLYLVKHDGAILRSRDEGESWTPIAEDRFIGISRIEVDPSHPETVYVCGRTNVLNELHRSQDGGDTWRAMGTRLDALDFHPLDPRVLYGFENVVVRRSLDGGVTWEDLGLIFGSVTGFEFHPTDPLTFYAHGPSYIYRTKDGGEIWETIRSNLGGFSALAIRGAPFEIWAGFRFSGVSVSQDGGDTWTARNDGLDNSLISDFLVDSSNSSRLFVGTESGLFESSNAGDYWTRSDKGMTNTFVRTLTADPFGDTLYAGGGGVGRGFFRSRDSGTTWNQLVTWLGTINVDAVGIAPSNPDVVQLGATMDAYVCPGDCWNRRLLDSGDGGETWTLSFELPAFSARDFAIDAQTPSTAYVAGWGLWKRVASAEWTPVYGSEGVVEIEIDPQTPSTLYLGTLGNGLLKSEDGAATIVPTLLGDPFRVSQIAIDPSDTRIIWVAAEVVVMRSPDAGASWEPRSEGFSLSDATFSDILVHPDWSENVFASILPNLSTSPGGGVFESRDAGLTWQPLLDGLTNRHVTRLGFTRGSVFLHAATLGRGVLRLQLPFVDAESGSYARFVDALAAAGVTAGCGRRRFCTDDPVSRAQSSVFLLRALEGSDYFPPAANGTVFADVPLDAFAAAWIEEIAARGITAGCGGGLFCPDQSVTRAQAAVLNLRTKNGETYQPPPATGTMFADVPLSHFAAAWIEEFARLGYTAGCAPNQFCPEQSVSRGQMAVFLAAVFALL